MRIKDALDVAYCVTNVTPNPGSLGSLRLEPWKVRQTVDLNDAETGEFTWQGDARPRALPNHHVLTAIVAAADASGISKKEIEDAAMPKGIGPDTARLWIKNHIDTRYGVGPSRCGV